MNMEQLMKERLGTVGDLRTQKEYMGGSVVNSNNNQLNEISTQVNELKELSHPILLCRASGGRSSVATQILTQAATECVNAGSWMDVNYYKNQTN